MFAALKVETLRPHATQQAYYLSKHRFNVGVAGRRSGKTELAARKTIKCALRGTAFADPRFLLGAPTYAQAKRIWWRRTKAMIPKRFITSISETELMIRFITGAEIHVVGMDKPERCEGVGWDGAVLDEFGNMKPEAFTLHLRPALSDRLGWCDFIGVPEGRNHYYELDKRASAEMSEYGEASRYGRFHWVSADILPASEIEDAKRDLDELSFQQEYEASFINFSGRTYYTFDENTHCHKLDYNPKEELILMFDFNVSPGTAVIAQEQMLPVIFTVGQKPMMGTGAIGEVWIPRHSTSVKVCNKIIADWGRHQGRVSVYGDATGGAEGSAKLAGSDWDIIEKMLYNHFGRDRVFMRVKRANPRERQRVNAVNSRLLSLTGEVKMCVDPKRAPHTVEDLEGVRVLEGGSGEIDKKHDPMLTHLTDGLGYYIEYEFPIDGERKPVRIVGV